jgi:hypothetical protein
MSKFFLGTPDYNGDRYILRQSRGGTNTSYGEVVTALQFDHRPGWAWRELGGAANGPYDSPEAALAAFIQARKRKKKSCPPSTN